MLDKVSFERRFSRNFNKDKRLPLSEMRFGSLPLTTNRGDIYPRIFSRGEFSEECCGSNYVFSPKGKACCARLIGRFNPYSTYDILPSQLSYGARVGIYISFGKTLIVYAEVKGSIAEFSYSLDGDEVVLGECAYEEGMHLLFTYHAGSCVEIYTEKCGVIRHITDAKIDSCECLIQESCFSSAEAGLYVAGESNISIRSVDNYLDCGIMQADIRPVKYENGEAIVEQGKVYFTFTSRFESGSMQQIASYELSSCRFELVGALLFDLGDGKWCSDVASSLLYDRRAGLWRIWFCAFSHGHVPAYSEMNADPRFGINVIDAKALPSVDDEYSFGGIREDEDPDFIYDEASGKWYFSVCRMDSSIGQYRYYLFESDYPDRDYKFVARTEGSIETTGGCFARLFGRIYHVFGRSFSERAKYDYCSVPEMKKLGELKCHHDDGGFRGWGGVIEVPIGTRKRLLWVTFDRTRGSSYNWSYGNLYFFESRDTYKLDE